MDNRVSKTITVNITEDVTIVEVSKATQKYNSEIYLKKVVNGTPHEINLKSFLGLITLQLKNGDKLTIEAEGNDAQAALDEVANYLAKE